MFVSLRSTIKQIPSSLKRLPLNTKGRLIGALSLSLISAASFSHPGGLDALGGHTDKETNRYHCHSQKCKDNQKQVDDATREAEQQGRPLSYVYRREDWKHWSDFDRDCMNTRHEILLAQASGQVKLSPNGCYVSTGTWHDPFSGTTLHRASDLDVDHVVPLKWANDHGGDHWPSNMKEQFANDPDNLIAVDDALNQSKGAQGPTEWMPPNQAYHCEYLARWQTVLSKYSDLRFTRIEQQAFKRLQQNCH